MPVGLCVCPGGGGRACSVFCWGVGGARAFLLEGSLYVQASFSTRINNFFEHFFFLRGSAHLW
jgi:hypothetical protein